jgi:predicted DNA-binding ribbon-helix-helix protein
MIDKQVKQQTGISFKVNNQFYKQLKIRATEEDKTIKDFIIKLIENELGSKNE